MTSPVIFLDLDGVLADFTAGVRTLYRKPAPTPADLGKSLGGALGIDEGMMWARIEEAGRGFWEDLPATAHANALVALAREHGEAVILSAPASSPNAAAGKMAWFHKRFGKRNKDVILTARKELLAGPGRLLIDDSRANVAAFTAAGGAALLWPTLENGEAQEGVDALALARAACARISAMASVTDITTTTSSSAPSLGTSA